MKAYVVGGAVRDRLLGRPVNDHDWVVVGSTPEAMVAAGFKPVGRDFPVFLHPETHEEYALARTERKSGRGYHGFQFQAAPDVTIEEDLARRDLTINAIAEDPETGVLVDPYGGQSDLRSRVLRHVSEAFADDPVRLLRLARLAARYADFSIAPETMALCARMVDAGEVDALVAERVWQELSRGLMEPRPDRMLQVLRDCGALARLLPEVDRLWGEPRPTADGAAADSGEHLLRVLRVAARLQAPLTVRFACLCHDLGRATADEEGRGHEARSAALAEAVCERWRVPADCRALAVLAAREHRNIHRSEALDAKALVQLFDRCDAWRRPERFADLLLACECEWRGRHGQEERAYAPRPRLAAALAAARAVDTAAVAAEAAAQRRTGPAIGEAIAQARAQAIRTAGLAD